MAALCSASTSTTASASTPLMPTGTPVPVVLSLALVAVPPRDTGDRASRGSGRVELTPPAPTAIGAQVTAAKQALQDKGTLKAAAGQLAVVAIPPVPVGGDSAANRELGRYLVDARGWDDAQFTCVDKIWTQESNWSTSADNPSSSAYGIPQALPGSKMASAGPDWATNPATQISWGLGYIADRYGSACSAWSFKSAHGWY